MIRNLGAVLTVLARQEAREADMHADIDAWHAPGECHHLVARREARRERTARKRAEALARRPMRVIRREASRRGLPLHGPRWQGLVGRLMRNLP